MKQKVNRWTVLVLFMLVIPFVTTGQGNVDKTAVKENRMTNTSGISGIVFFKTKMLKDLQEFYVKRVGATLWMDQGGCIILKFGNMLFGFCQRDDADLDALITFFYEKKEDVDKAHNIFKDTAQSSPKMNKKYNIYHFFAKDPEGRNIEFQWFAGPIDWDYKRFE